MNPRYLLMSDIANMADIIDHYDDKIKDYESHLKLAGKTLEIANREQPSRLVYYDQLRVELYSAVKYMESKLSETKGRLWQKYLENYSIKLSSRDLEQYTTKDPAYMQQLELFLEIKELYNRCESIVEAFKARGFALKNIVEARIAQVANEVM